ncbi:hypothetical protein E4U42_006490 [Claviceps africana]|uniref:Uncharacterized protein n=1 Tax=Claviceps africana TaxID=83212 RepID=A0A8K0J2X6_9HYPO|nr:hypothetical protein E4U42_006490 [Claviceps africana]
MCMYRKSCKRTYLDVNRATLFGFKDEGFHVDGHESRVTSHDDDNDNDDDDDDDEGNTARILGQTASRRMSDTFSTRR